MTSPPTFLVELLDEVLHFLHTDRDVESLRNCSYASQTLRPLSQKLLFQEIQFTYDMPGWDDIANKPTKRVTLWKAFNNLLDRSPHLSAYVKALDITQGAWIQMFEVDGIDSLTKICNRLTNKQKISIRLDHKFGKAVMLFWALFPSKVRAALLQSLTTPSMVEIDLSGILDFPAALLSGFPTTLKKLTLRSLNVNASIIRQLDSAEFGPNNLQSTAQHRFSLDALVICGIPPPGNMFRWLTSNICPIDFRQVRDLVLAMNESREVDDNFTDLKDLENFLEVFSSNLKRLTIRLGPPHGERLPWYLNRWKWWPYPIAPPDIARTLPSLNFLELECLWYGRADDATRTLSWINEILNKLSGMRMQTIVLNMEIYMKEHELQEIGWDTLTSCLDDKLKSIIKLRFSGLKEGGKEIFLQNEILRSFPKGIVFV
ncbi:hypothetical protein GALMADRAFT_224796 [Galerina marginata CBS 339.88]|uniref:F-box domain-containing protein n=1 Tax=Galerina marginata (strain CBS 339.88) TaxID=685588 RepID=A0A067TEM1_GALM3|nr:hypothetical protein GALMADRAFT_224796 [Galerina marginata CBS 339.88]